jgi:hypothetical protein
MLRNGATQALSFMDLVWKICKERADGVTRPGNAFSCASLRILNIVSMSDFFSDEEGRGSASKLGWCGIARYGVVAALQELGTGRVRKGSRAPRNVF